MNTIYIAMIFIGFSGYTLNFMHLWFTPISEIDSKFYKDFRKRMYLLAFLVVISEIAILLNNL